ncbi:hypothetical protein LCGC14_2517070, partial [marine sediment metagenome]
MAFQTKYQITFKDYFLNTYNIYFATDPWAGAVTTFTPGVNPLKVRWHGTEKNQTIVGSTVEIQVVYQDEVEELFTEADQVIRVFVTLGGMMNWYGFITPYQSRRVLGTKPHYATFFCTDQLGLLKDMKFEDASADPYFGIDDELTFIENILLKTGIGQQLIIRENLNVYESAHDKTVADSPLNQTFWYPEMYWDAVTDERSECYEVLTDIVKKYGARIFQSDFCWFIQRPNAMWSSHTERRYDANFAYLANETGYKQWNRVDEGGVWMGEVEITKIQRTGRVEITADPGVRENLIKNGTFDDFAGFLYWTNSGADAEVFDGYLRIRDKDAGGVPVDNVNIQTSVFGITEMILQIEFKGFYENGTTCKLHFGIYYVEGDVWWNSATSAWVGAETHYIFDVHAIVTQSMTSFARLSIPISLEYLDGDYGNIIIRMYEVEDNNDTDAHMDIRNVRLEPTYGTHLKTTEIAVAENTVSANKIVKDT